MDLVLSGDLHAANEKFKGIVEANVIESIEDEKLKIAQTLFAEEPEEGDDEEEEDDDDDKDKEDVDEGEMPPALKKAMDKKKGDDDDEEEDEDEDPVGEKKEELSYDPGEASTNAPLAENSFVQKIAQHLSGHRVKEQYKKKV